MIALLRFSVRNNESFILPLKSETAPCSHHEAASNDYIKRTYIITKNKDMKLHITKQHLQKASETKSDVLSIALQEIFPGCKVGNYDPEDERSLLIGSGKDIVIVRLPSKAQRAILKPTSFNISISNGQMERINSHYSVINDAVCA